MPNQPAPVYRFDGFTIDLADARLRRGREAVAIEPKVFFLLLYLVENRDRLVTKHELLNTIWSDVAVTENALTRTVARLRKILGDDPREPRYIETVHGLGYRFVGVVGDVTEPTRESSGAAARPQVGKPSTPPRQRGRRHVLWLLGAVAAMALVGTISKQRTEIGTSPSLAVPTPEPNSPALDRGGALDPHRIAALPIVDLSDQDNAYFVDGLTEQMISTLARIEDLQVVPRTTIMTYKEMDRRITDIGRELGAGTVLEGSVRRSGDLLRISVRLVDVGREQTLWSMELDRPLRDIFAIQSEVAVHVAEALQTTISPRVLERMRRGPTDLISAWDHYLKGRHFHRQRTRVGLGSAVIAYRKALELDPDFALAYAQIANVHVLLALTMEVPEGWPGEALAAAERALELDPRLSEAYRALGGVAFCQGRRHRAFELTSKAVALDPYSEAAIYNASSFAQAIGRLDEAALLLHHSDAIRPSHRAALAIYFWELGLEARARKLTAEALAEEPLTIYLNLYLALREMLAGKFDRVRSRLEPLERAYPLWEGIWLAHGMVETRAGYPEAALARYEQVLALAEKGNAEAEIRSAQIRWQRGEESAAQEALDGLAAQTRHAIEQGSDSWNLRWQLAAIEAVQGNGDAALGWFEEAVDLGNYRHLFDASDPLFELLWDDPRFRKQLERMQARVGAMRERVVHEIGDVNRSSS